MCASLPALSMKRKTATGTQPISNFFKRLSHDGGIKKERKRTNEAPRRRHSSSSSTSQVVASSNDSLPEPTDEQRRILEHEPRAGEHVIINAFAGSGKTTTCRLLAVRFAGKRVLYIVFNRDAKEKAKVIMPKKNVKCMTVHAVGLAFCLSRLPAGTKSPEIGSQASKLFKTYERDATIALDKFFHDDKHDALSADVHFSHCSSSEECDAALKKATQCWNEMRARTASYYTFDALLKLMVVERQDSWQWVSDCYDVILVDEAQDTQQLLLPWYAGFTSLPVYFIGDRHQAIYGFTGARDAMEYAARMPSTTHFNLTQSFRFGEPVASLASKLLHDMGLLDSSISICGSAERTTRLECSESALLDTSDVVYIARTNSSILSEAFRAAANDKTIRITGRIEDVMRRIKAILNEHVFNVGFNRQGQTYESRLKALDEKEALHLADKKNNEPLSEDEEEDRRLLRIICQYGEVRTRNLIKTIEDSRDDPNPDVTLTTVHASKGLEFDNVEMLGDFQPLFLLKKVLALTEPKRNRNVGGGGDDDDDDDSLLQKLRNLHLSERERDKLQKLVFRRQRGMTVRQQFAEEVHLYYVAATRVRKVLNLNQQLYAFSNGEYIRDINPHNAFDDSAEPHARNHF